MTTEPRDTAIRRLKRRAVFSLVSGPVCALCFVVYLAYPGMAFQRDAILLSAPLAIAATDLALLLVRRDSRLQFVLGIAATINVTIIAGASILGLVGAKFFLFYFVFTVWLIITLVARVMLSAAIFELHRALSTSRGWRTGLASSSGWALRFEGGDTLAVELRERTRPFATYRMLFGDVDGLLTIRNYADSSGGQADLPITDVPQRLSITTIRPATSSITPAIRSARVPARRTCRSLPVTGGTGSSWRPRYVAASSRCLTIT